MNALIETLPGPIVLRRTDELPAGWSYPSLQEVGELVTGSTPPKGRTEFYGGDFPLVKPGELLSCIVSSADDTLTDAGAKAADVAPEGSVLVSCIGNLGKVGLAACAVAFNQQINAIIPHNMASSRWVFYAVQTPGFRAQLNSVASATTISIVNKGKFSKLRIPWAPLDEQQRIVAEIEKQFTRLEAGVASLNRVQTALKRYRASVLKGACEGKLVPTEAELAKTGNRITKFETGEALLARILSERRQNWQGLGKYKEPAAPETAKLPELADGWTWATVEQLAAPEPNSITDGPFGSNLKTEHYKDSGPRVIRLQNIGDGVYVDEEAHISQAHFERLPKHRIFANDVVIAGFGENPPRSCIIPESLGPAIVKADCIRFKPHRSVMPKYMNAALNSDPVRKRTKGMVHGVGRPRLNLGEIKSIVLPLPPLAEQTRIVAEVERRLSVVEELEAVRSVTLDRATRLRQSILQHSFARSPIVK